MHLKKDNYTAQEKRLLALLPPDGAKITSRDLTSKRKRVSRWPVENPQNAVSVTMRNLIKKVAKNREAFRVRKSYRRGPHPVEYWMEPA